MESATTELGIVLRRLRKAHKRPQHDVAKQMGVNKDKPGQFEKGEKIPTVNEIRKMREALTLNAGEWKELWGAYSRATTGITPAESLEPTAPLDPKQHALAHLITARDALHNPALRPRVTLEPEGERAMERWGERVKPAVESRLERRVASLENEIRLLRNQGPKKSPKSIFKPPSEAPHAWEKTSKKGYLGGQWDYLITDEETKHDVFGKFTVEYADEEASITVEGMNWYCKDEASPKEVRATWYGEFIDGPGGDDKRLLWFVVHPKEVRPEDATPDEPYLGVADLTIVKRSKKKNPILLFGTFMDFDNRPNKGYMYAWRSDSATKINLAKEVEKFHSVTS